MHGLLVRIGVGAALLAALAAGCGGGSASSGGGSLQDALGTVRDGEAARAYFGWADLKRMRAEQALPATFAGMRGRYIAPSSALNVINSQLITSGYTIAQKTGFDLISGDQLMATGEPPRRAVRLDGTDGKRFADLMRSLGAHPQDALGRHFLAIGNEGSIDVTGKPAQLGILNELDRAVTSGDQAAWGPFEAPVDEILGGSGQSLADNPVFAEAADCLGDVVSAAFYPTKDADVDGPAVMVAIGVRAFAKGARPPYQQVLCVVTPDRDAARKYADGMKRGFGPDAVDPRANAKVSEFVSHADVDVSEGHDRAAARAVITLADHRPPGFLLQVLFNRALRVYLGQPASPLP